MKRFFSGFLCLALLAGCSSLPRINAFARAVPEEPLPFRANLSAQRGAKDFSVNVVTRGATIDLWRESARFQGTQYCLRRFGSSKILWQQAGPGQDWAVVATGNGNVVVRGSCQAR